MHRSHSHQNHVGRLYWRTSRLFPYQFWGANFCPKLHFGSYYNPVRWLFPCKKGRECWPGRNF